MRRARGRQRPVRRVTLQVGRAQQQVLGRNVLVLEVCCLAEGLLQYFVQRLAQGRLLRRTGHARQLFLHLMKLELQPLGGNANLVEHGRNHALAVFDQGQQQMHRLNFRIPQFGGPRLRLGHRLLRLDGQFFPANCHCS